MRRRMTWIVVTCCILAGRAVLAAPTINYQGRITAGGNNYTGTGYFKFVLVNGDSDGVWSNDGTSGSGEPTGWVTNEVNNGLFNIELGEDMTEMSPLVFHEDELCLRTWFSTNGASFEQLTPDVEIRPMDLAHIDTGDAVFVDNDGNADFDNVQDAINFAATNDEVWAVMIMPGHYALSAPLSFPSGEYTRIKGVGDFESVHIESTSGPALTAGDGCVENLTLLGVPAISDSGSESDYNLNLKRCQIRRVEGGATGPMAELTGDGSLDAFECRFETDNGDNTCLKLSGDVNCNLKHTDFWCGDASTAFGVHFDDFDGHATFESCSISIGSGASIYVSSGSGSAEFELCQLENPVWIGGGDLGLELRNCSTRFIGIENANGSLDCRNCRIDSFSGFPALNVNSNSSDARVTLYDCEISADNSHACYLRNGPLSQFELRRCVIDVSGSDSHGVLMDDFQGDWRIEDCDIRGNGVSLLITNGAEWSSGTIVDSILESGLLVGDSSLGMTVSGSSVGGLVLFDVVGWSAFTRSQIFGDVLEKAVQLRKRNTRASFHSCRITAMSNTAMYVEDTANVLVQQTDIEAESGVAVEFIATVNVPVDSWIGMTLRNCRVRNWSGDVTDKDAIVVSNSPANVAREVAVDLELAGTKVDSDVRDGISAAFCEVELTSADVEGSRYGVKAVNSDVRLDGSFAFGGAHGVWVEDGELEAANSDMGGEEGHGVLFEGEGMLELKHCSLFGGEDLEGIGASDACGLHVSGGGLALIQGCQLNSDPNPALDCTDGQLLCSDTWFLTGTNAGAVVRGTNIVASFDRCNFYSYGHFNGATNRNACLVLYGATDVATPRITGCMFEPDTRAPYAIDLQGGATTGNVIMANSCMTTNMSPNIGLLPPVALPYGNYILPSRP